MIVIMDPKTFYFYCERPKDVDDNLKDNIIKSNEFWDWTIIVQIWAQKQYSWTQKTDSTWKIKQTCCSSKSVYSLHVEKYTKTV